MAEALNAPFAIATVCTFVTPSDGCVKRTPSATCSNMRGSRPVRSLNRSILALTSLSLAELLAKMRGIASLRSCFTFTCATASDSGSEAISVGAGGVTLRPRVCAAASSCEKSATKTIASVKSLSFTTKLPFCEQYESLVDALTCHGVVFR